MLYYLSAGSILSALIMAACATFYYIHGESEHSIGWLWCLLSIAIWVVLFFFLHLGLLYQFLGQLALFVVITVVNMSRKRTARIIK